MTIIRKNLPYLFKMNFRGFSGTFSTYFWAYRVKETAIKLFFFAHAEIPRTLILSFTQKLR